ncbi:MAG: HAD family hydrolase [Mycobacteriaceae bacterium]
MKIQVVVFDFDGLLMDTDSCLLASWQHEWRQHGLELDADTFWPDHGGDVSQEQHDRLAQAVGPSYDQDASHARRVAYRDRLLAGLGLRPGIEGWLQQAQAAGLRLAVASSSPRAWVHRLLSGAGCIERFELMACGDEVPQTKPAPEVYLLALDRLGVPAELAVAVEDSPHGVAAARAAGIRCVAIPNPHAHPARFASANLVLTSAVQMALIDVLDTINACGHA